MPTNDQRRQKAIDLHRQGVGPTEICAQVGVSRSTLWRWLKTPPSDGHAAAKKARKRRPTRARKPSPLAPSPDEEIEPLRPAAAAVVERLRRRRLSSLAPERLEAAARVWALGLGDERAALALGVSPAWLRDQMTAAAQDYAAGRDTNAVRLAMLRELAPLELTARLGDRMVALAFDDDPKIALKAASWLLERREAAFAGQPAVQVNFAAQVSAGAPTSLKDLLVETRRRREEQAQVVDVIAEVGG